MSVIEIDGLKKQYGNFTAVEDVNLSVEEGEVFGFLGPNGAGKSTTIGMLLGFRNPTAGRAMVLGHNATSESRAVRARTGLLPEGFDLYENLSGREHIVSAIETKNATDDPDDILERVGLDPADAQRAAGGYSKGMTQRLALGIALVGQPDLLILDEPSSGLDPKGIKRLRAIVEEEIERGATVFFSSHILSQVEKVCDRVGIMYEGRLVAVDDIDTLREHAGMNVVVELELQDVPKRSVIQSIDGVREVAITNNTVQVTCSDQEAKMNVLNRLSEITTVLDFDTEDTSLEALFEKYTNDESGTEESVKKNVAATNGGDRK